MTAKSTRELYEDWAPFIEFSRPQLPDVELFLEEEIYVEQVPLRPGVSAGGPRDPGYSGPLKKKFRRFSSG